ncbi:MAG TPA: hypothetical protein VEA69_07760 [Tepidisphaeraceae bacterium]|nr:hypothetical protein [Tepidisphaeraceae bacterium]
MAALLATVGLGAIGCSSPSMQPGDLSLVQIDSDKPRAGNVYLLRGFIGIWSTGIDALGAKINEDGVRANVYRNEQWEDVRDALIEKYKDHKVYEPLVLIGHSWGADHTVDIARALDPHGISVDLIITLDPVTPNKVPKNVKWVCNIYQTNGIWQGIPVFRGVALEPEPDAKGKLENLAVRTDRTDLLEPDTDHYNIEKNEKVHAEVLKVLKQACPDRQSWVRANPGYRPPARVAAAPVAGTGAAVTARHVMPTTPAAPTTPARVSPTKVSTPTSTGGPTGPRSEVAPSLVTPKAALSASPSLVVPAAAAVPVIPPVVGPPAQPARAATDAGNLIAQ